MFTLKKTSQNIFQLLLVVGSLCMSFAASCDYERIAATAPTSDFHPNGDGTVTHLATGLTWMQCSLGQEWQDGDCLDSAGFYSWSQAQETAENFEFAGFQDWRLPNIKELNSIVEYACFYPTINVSVFPNSNALVNAWSSTPDINNDNNILVQSFEEGDVWSAIKDDYYHEISVRLVRGQ